MFHVKPVGDSGQLHKKLPGMEDQITLEQHVAFTRLEGRFVRLRLNSQHCHDEA